MEVPEEETAVQPEELGVPRDAVQRGEVDVTGPEGTRITDEGDIVIPASTTQVAREERYEESEEEEGEEEENQDNEEEVVVEVPEEMLPDEEVTIGSPEQPAEEEEVEEEGDQGDEEVIREPRDYQGVDDAVPEDTVSEEEYAEPEVSEGEPVGEQASLIDIGLGVGAGVVTSPPGERTVPATGGREDALDLLDEAVSADVGGQQQEGVTDATGDLASEVTQTPTIDQQLRLRGQLDQALKQAVTTQTQTVQQTQQQQQRTQTQHQFDTPYEYQTTTTKRRKKRPESEEEEGSSRGSAGGGPTPSASDPRLSIGWVNETVADIASGRGTVGISPSQQRLSREPEPVQLTEQRATTLALSGTQTQQQRVADTKDFLSFGVAGDGSSASDDQPRADPLADRRQQPPARERGVGAFGGGGQSGGGDRDQGGLGLDLLGTSSSSDDNGDDDPLSVNVDLL